MTPRDVMIRKAECYIVIYPMGCFVSRSRLLTAEAMPMNDETFSSSQFSSKAESFNLTRHVLPECHSRVIKSPKSYKWLTSRAAAANTPGWNHSGAKRWAWIISVGDDFTLVMREGAYWPLKLTCSWHLENTRVIFSLSQQRDKSHTPSSIPTILSVCTYVCCSCRQM